LNRVRFLDLSIESGEDKQDTEQYHGAIRKDMDPCVMLVKGNHFMAVLGRVKV
jgi:hypothetical protein